MRRDYDEGLFYWVYNLLSILIHETRKTQNVDIVDLITMLFTSAFSYAGIIFYGISKLSKVLSDRILQFLRNISNYEYRSVY